MAAHVTAVSSSPKQWFQRKGSREEKNQQHVDETMSQLRSLRYHGYSAKPWEDAQGNIVWPWIRIKLAAVVFSQTFEMAMGALILGNLVLIMYETDEDAKCYPDYAEDFGLCPFRSDHVLWVQITNLVVLLLYSLECMVRIYVERTLFFCNRWNQIDFIIVGFGWLDFALADTLSISLLRMSRLIRVARAVRLLISIPEFYLLINGLYSSIKAILFGALLLVSVIVIWAVVSVQLLHPITSRQSYPMCQRCPTGFSTVFNAGLTLFQQLVAGDSWGQINIPLVETAPLTMFLLFAMMMTISLGLMNLILAVIVERAAEARENDHEEKIKQKQNQRARSMEDLAKLCASMDIDSNGLISLAEMKKGYDEVDEFAKLMQVMDMKKEDMETVFNVMADSVTDEVSYLDFCKSLSSFVKRDPIIMQSLVKFSVMEVRKILREEVLTVLDEHTDMLRELLPQRPQREGCNVPEIDGVESSTLFKKRADMGDSRSRRVLQDGRRKAQDATYAGGMSSLAAIHSELQLLLAKAEAIADSVLNPSNMSEGIGSLDVASSEVVNGQPDQLPDLLCSGFQDIALEAEHLRKQCHQIVNNLSFQFRHGLASDTEGVSSAMYTVKQF